MVLNDVTRLSEGVALGLLLGVALGLLLGVALGLPLGVALGLPLGVALGLPLGVALGLPLGVALGLPLGVALGLPLGVAFGLPLGVALGLPLGVALGSPLGVAFGLPLGVALKLLVETSWTKGGVPSVIVCVVFGLSASVILFSASARIGICPASITAIAVHSNAAVIRLPIFIQVPAPFSFASQVRGRWIVHELYYTKTKRSISEKQVDRSLLFAR